MYLNRRKNIWIIILMTFVMSWTGIAFASNFATSGVMSEEHLIAIQHLSQKNHNHDVLSEIKTPCHTSANEMNHGHEIYQPNMIHHDCKAEHLKASSEKSHAWCVDCSITHCQTQVCDLNADVLSYIEMQVFSVLAEFNTAYRTFQSSDFRQDILRPPQI